MNLRVEEAGINPVTCWKKALKYPIMKPASGCNSVVECLLPKQGAVGSNPITRSVFCLKTGLLSSDVFLELVFCLTFIIALPSFLVFLFVCILRLLLPGRALIHWLYGYYCVPLFGKAKRVERQRFRIVIAV